MTKKDQDNLAKLYLENFADNDEDFFNDEELSSGRIERLEEYIAKLTNTYKDLQLRGTNEFELSDVRQNLINAKKTLSKFMGDEVDDDFDT